MAPNINLLLLALCILSIVFIQKNYVEAVWLAKGVGRVLDIHTTNNDDIVIVGTEAGVIAGLDGKTGNVIWRSVQREDESVVGIKSNSKYTVAITGNNVLLPHDILKNDNDHQDTRPDNFHASTEDNKNTWNNLSTSGRAYFNGLSAIRVYNKTSGGLLWVYNDINYRKELNSAGFLDWDLQFVSSDSTVSSTDNTRFAFVQNNELKIVELINKRRFDPRIILNVNAAMYASQFPELSNRLMFRRIIPFQENLLLLATIQTPETLEKNESNVDFVIFVFHASSGTLKQIKLFPVHLPFPETTSQTISEGGSRFRYPLIWNNQGVVVFFNFLTQTLYSIPINTNLFLQNETGKEMELTIESRPSIFSKDFASESARIASTISEESNLSISQLRGYAYSKLYVNKWAWNVVNGVIIVSNGFETFEYAAVNLKQIFHKNGYWVKAGHYQLHYNGSNLTLQDSKTVFSVAIEGRNKILCASIWRGRDGIQRSIISFEDMSLITILLKKNFQSVVAWSREESLTTIQQVAHYKLPKHFQMKKKHSFSYQTILSALRSWIFSFAINFGTDKETGYFTESIPSKNTPNLVNLNNALTNIIIVATCGGQSIIGLDESSGHVIWRISDPVQFRGSLTHFTIPIERQLQCDSFSEKMIQLSFLLDSNKTHYNATRQEMIHFRSKANDGLLPKTSSPKIMLLNVKQGYSDRFGELEKILAVIWESTNTVSWFSPRTGSVVAPDINVNLKGQWVMYTRTLEHVKNSALIIINKAQQQLHCVSPNGFCSEEFKQGLPVFKVFKNTIMSTSCIFLCKHLLDIFIDGISYPFPSKTDGVSPLGWKMNFTQTEDIIGIAQPNEEYDIVPTIIRGDGTQLQKVFSKNIIALLTLYKQGLRLHIVDIQTGRILLSDNLPEGGTTPSQLIMRENKIIISYWNAQRFRHEIASLEIYYHTIEPEFRNPLYYTKAAAPPSNMNFLVFDKTFILPTGPIRAATFSHSKLGLSPQSLLLATAKGQIICLNHRLISPRRPYPKVLQQSQNKIKKSPEDLEEGLTPYSALLPISAADIISKEQQIHRVNGLFSDSTRLESTSIVFAYGLDIFYALVQPAAAFDAVSESFNQTLLTTILIGAFILVAYARRKAHEKDILLRWK